MARLSIALCFLVAAFFTFSNTLPGDWPPPNQTLGQPWPKPMNFTQDTSNIQMLVHTTFQFTVSGNDCVLLRSAIDRYRKIIFLAGKGKKYQSTSNDSSRKLGDTPILPSLDINILNPCEDFPSLQMDEKYNLTVVTGSAKLTANNIWGALRGLETFSQLVYEARDGTMQIYGVKVVDQPQYAHRGVLLDTSRHFLSVDVIKANIETMAYNKMNVFHWHIVDDQSFPYESRTFPDLSGKGAWTPNHVYSQADIADIIDFARQRGVRVIPEFDTPGHNACWENGMPGLHTKCCDSTGKPNGYLGPIDPTGNVTWPFLTGLMKELSEVFPDKYVHLGGDEVGYGCWQSNPNITKWMQQMGYGTNYTLLEQYYEKKLFGIVSGFGGGYIVWEEIFDNQVQVNPDTVIQVWTGDWLSKLGRITGQKLQALISAPWYLDTIHYAVDWTKYYQVNPVGFNGTAEQQALVIGGEACLWAEYVDGTNVQHRLWPRASAVAERLWSPGWVNNTYEAYNRMAEHRCRMVKRGIPAEEPNGPRYCTYEYDPDVRNSMYW